MATHKDNDAVELPELDDMTIDRMESAVFAEIDADRKSDRIRGKKTRKRLQVGLGVAASTVLVGLVAVPALTGAFAPTANETAADSSGGMQLQSSEGFAIDRGAPNMPSAQMEESATTDSVAADTATAERDVITNGYATVVVPDVNKAIDDLSASVTESGGFVSGLTIGDNYYQAYSDSQDAREAVSAEITRGSITIRVPASDINEYVNALSEYGDVTSTQIDRTDVTEQRIDLEARTESTRASVARLIELMDRAGSVSELAEVEAQLSVRQADLESFEQQLESLKDQVAMSTFTVEFSTKSAPQSADPQSFGDGLLAGWNGFIAALNGLIVAVGFILPWLGVALVAGVVVLLIVRSRRRGKRQPAVEG